LALQELLALIEGLTPAERQELLNQKEITWLQGRILIRLRRDGTLSPPQILKTLKASEELNERLLRSGFNGSARVYRPPRNLELLLHLFVPQADCDPLIGDLEERYRKLAKRLGIGRANTWYTKQVLTSIWPLLRAGVRRVGSTAVVSVVTFALRLFGMGSLADELKRAVVKKKQQGT
jgi:hypothetical protein